LVERSPESSGLSVVRRIEKAGEFGGNLHIKDEDNPEPSPD